MISVLFVCLGNICRSPLAQGIFEKIVQEREWTDFFYVDSAGTSAYHKGQKPHAGSLAVAHKHGVSLEAQRSRPVSFNDASEFDYLIAMDKENYHSLVNEFGVVSEQVFLLRGFERGMYSFAQRIPNSEKSDVPDPYGRGDKAFEYVYILIEESLQQFADFLQSKHSLP